MICVFFLLSMIRTFFEKEQRSLMLPPVKVQELEKLKSRLEQALVAVKRKEADSPGKAGDGTSIAI